MTARENLSFQSTKNGKPINTTFLSLEASIIKLALTFNVIHRAFTVKIKIHL